ncbi:hypothetical protein G7Y89_g8513 [Cudoniella acicularis]|uniref:Uncharacterized protein n=1 Tax=Cudoniella acicularis TaxID=354080 RepID=A0A8H4RIQ5_9HELO|nr:hypothetical protein G7Y89_g8513 [Cudoniella acicularis]
MNPNNRNWSKKGITKLDTNSTTSTPAAPPTKTARKDISKNKTPLIRVPILQHAVDPDILTLMPQSTAAHHKDGYANPWQKSGYSGRGTGSEIVLQKVPSCLMLPPQWGIIHDKFIAYLATHAPLDKKGRVPRHEETQERWKSEDIVGLLKERFDCLRNADIRPSAIEMRLALLDAGDNGYFQSPYGIFKDEKWGHGI